MCVLVFVCFLYSCPSISSPKIRHAGLNFSSCYSGRSLGMAGLKLEWIIWMINFLLFQTEVKHDKLNPGTHLCSLLKRFKKKNFFLNSKGIIKGINSQGHFFWEQKRTQRQVRIKHRFWEQSCEAGLCMKEGGMGMGMGRGQEEVSSWAPAERRRLRS